MTSCDLVLTTGSACPSGQPGQEHLLQGLDRTTSRLPDQLTSTDFLVLPYVLGKGASATVKIAIHKPTRIQYAMKKLSLSSEFRNANLRLLQTELSLQEDLDHPNLLKVIGHFTEQDHATLVLELVKGQTLFSLIRSQKRLTEDAAQPLFRQVCQALQHLHSKDIAHRDVKPENILVDRQELVKVCDFGCAVRGTAPQYDGNGTLEYLAPEIVLEQGATKKVDCWALGVLLYEMLHGQSPFKGLSDIDTARKILRAHLRFNPSLSEEACNLISSLLERDPLKRLSVNEVLQHPWFQDSTFLDDSLSERLTADTSSQLVPQSARRQQRKKMSNLRSQILLEEREAELLKLQQSLETPRPKKPSSWFTSLIRRLCK